MDAGRFGFIGLGNMGRPMATRLIEAGHRLTVYDTRGDAVERLTGIGAVAAASPAAVASETDAVFLSLPDSKVVEPVILGNDGVLAGSAPGKVVIDLSTSLPESSRRLHATLAEQGIPFLDAPVSGGVSGAAKGTLAVMVGGDEAVFKRFEPVLRTIGKNVFYIGGPGAGHTLKVVNNLLSLTACLATSEAMALLAKAGLPPRRCLEVIAASSGRNSAVEQKFPDHVLPRDFHMGFTLGLGFKDIGIATALGRDLRVPMPVGNLVQEITSLLVNSHGADADLMEMARQWEQWAGTEIRDEGAR
ncbi:MAG TPA: NAD(P)-dependent oxidoreductase [Dehalococcoidia bacterium]|nr:NAD(P)-dependent oxidoreductase [Dehalococcoidia bacterium]